MLHKNGAITALLNFRSLFVINLLFEIVLIIINLLF